MTSIDPTEIDLILPVARRKREAEDWALVLIAEGIPSKMIRLDRGFTLAVAPDAQHYASEILESWRVERADRAERLAQPLPRGATRLETALAFLFALALLAFHVGLESSGHWSEFRDWGKSQAALVLEGQWWRLVTALTLHSDLSHVVGNTLFGGFFLAAVAGRIGIGFAVLTFVMTGALGNFANALYYGFAHNSIGASTGVFGLVGVLAGLAAVGRHKTAPPGRGAWVAFAAGLAIVAMLGSGGPGIDVSAHLFGLAAGGLTGILLALPFSIQQEPKSSHQALAAFSAVAIIAFAWAHALP